MRPAPVLIVEDEPKLSALLADYLRAAGFGAEIVADGRAAVAVAAAVAPALVLLDLMLPGMDGTEVCRHLRRQGDVPIIMLTARVEEIDRLLGLELGADDYICKPFSPREVVARVRAVLRRSGAVPAADAGLRIDVERFEARLGERVLDLTPVEFRLLPALAAGGAAGCFRATSSSTGCTPIIASSPIAPWTATSRICAASSRRPYPAANRSARSTGWATSSTSKSPRHAWPGPPSLR